MKRVFVLQALCVLIISLCVAYAYDDGAWPSKIPFWPQYPSRKVQVLDGSWGFSYNNYKGDVTSKSINTKDIPKTNNTVVPSSFDYRAPGYEGPRGTAFYSTQVPITPGTTAVINFMGCSFYCNVYVDNEWIGDHRAGGFSPFWLTIPPSSNQNRDLFVVVDNRFNSTTAPVHTGGDFYLLGGIHRSVIVHEISDPKMYLQRVEVFPTSFSPAIVDINVVLGYNYTGSLPLKLTFDNDGGSSMSISATATNGTAKLTGIKVPNNPKPWSIESPNLHILSVALSNKDEINVRYGIRVFGKDKNSRITINDEVVKLHGHNRHTIYPDVGPSLTVAQIQQDVEILKDLGSNYVRGAHYPQDQRFLDICDEEGIIIWEEALGPSVTVQNIESTYFMQYQLQQMNEMISASVNHPSIMFWGYFNEGPSDDSRSCPGYAACAAAAHARDTTRFVTWADNHGLSDKCLKYADVISFNAYPGWYTESGNSSAPLSVWASLLNDAAKNYTQPITVSETGCEGLYEWVNTTTTMWGQAYQNLVINNDIEVILGNSRVTGLSIWVFADFKGNDSAQSVCGPCTYVPGTNNAININVACNGSCGLGCRPCGENHKGTVDFWRRKKQVYTVVQKLYHQQWP